MNKFDINNKLSVNNKWYMINLVKNVLELC